MDYDESLALDAEHYPDLIDRASRQTDINTQDAIDAQRLRAKQARIRWAPRSDGLCACGCGEEVNLRRLALGYGLTLECAERNERH